MNDGWETFKVKGNELLEYIQRAIHEGNVRRIVIKQGARTVAEFPLTVGVVGALAAPALAAIGALAGLLTDCTLEIERRPGAASASATTKQSAAPKKKPTKRSRRQARFTR